VWLDGEDLQSPSREDGVRLLRSSVAGSLRCLRRLRRPHGCPFESHPTALTPPQPRQGRSPETARRPPL